MFTIFCLHCPIKTLKQFNVLFINKATSNSFPVICLMPTLLLSFYMLNFFGLFSEMPKLLKWNNYFYPGPS